MTEHNQSWGTQNSGQAPAYPQQYPSYPQPSPQQQHMHGATRPKDIDISFWLWIVAIIVSVVGVVLTYTLIDTAALVDKSMQQTGQVPGRQPIPDMKGFMSALTSIMIVFVMVLDAVWLFFVFMLRKGANWARIIMTVLGGLWLLNQIFTLVGAAMLPSMDVTAQLRPWWSTALIIIDVVLVIAAGVFMYRPQANRFLMKR